MTPYTASELRAEIARLTRQRDEWNILGLSNHEDDERVAGQIADLRDDLYLAEHPEEFETPVSPELAA